jgi:hypothetical protein
LAKPWQFPSLKMYFYVVLGLRIGRCLKNFG